MLRVEHYRQQWAPNPLWIILPLIGLLCLAEVRRPQRHATPLVFGSLTVPENVDELWQKLPQSKLEPLLTTNFEEGDVTVVSGYWPVGRRQPSFEEYREWAAKFFAKDMFLVFFAPGEILEALRPLRPKEYENRTAWIVYDVEDFFASRLNAMWKDTLDVHGGSATLEDVLVEAEKLSCLRHATGANVFLSTRFVWAEAELFKSAKGDKCWPDPNKVGNVCTMLSMRKLGAWEETLLAAGEIPVFFHLRSNLDMKVISGSIDYLTGFWRVYYETVFEFYAKGAYVGDAVTMYRVAMARNPSMFSIVVPSRHDHYFLGEYYYKPMCW